MDTIYIKIKKDYQIKKFCLYGFFKNLKFFEPYLYLYLLANGMNLIHIGLMFSIREIIIYIFEIPSGVFADQYGKKTELLICFFFYICSFVLFFIGGPFIVFMIAMVFYGLGEAFRSGTHKAMIFGYLDHKGWEKEKSFVYGRTRSYSLLGSSLSSLIAIIFVIGFNATKWIFLISIIPYLLDFFLILSYPNYLNQKNQNNKFSFNNFIKESISLLRDIIKNKELLPILIESSSLDSIFKSLKDYIQPILAAILLLSFSNSTLNISADSFTKILLGLSYSLFYLLSSITTKRMYLLKLKFKSVNLISFMLLLFSIILLLLSLSVAFNWAIITLLLFQGLYLIYDARRPLMVEYIGDRIASNERATVLSIDSQLRAILVIVLAPLFGLISESFGYTWLFIFVGIFSLSVYAFLHKKKKS